MLQLGVFIPLAALLTLVNCHTYSSHVTFVTPISSFSHGVGTPFLSRRLGRPANHRFATAPGGSSYDTPLLHPGYPRPSVRQIALEDRAIGFVNSGLLNVHPEEALWPEGVFIPPLNPSSMGYGPNDQRAGHQTPDYSDGLSYPDPLLLTGLDAANAVNMITAHGELFFHEIPHYRLLQWLAKERRRNGLAGHLLGSERPGHNNFRQ